MWIFLRPKNLRFLISNNRKAKKATQNYLDFQDENHSNINVVGLNANRFSIQ